MRVALVHDWLTGMRGGERVLLELCRLFPQAPIFTLFHRRGSVAPQIESHPIHTSFLDRIPGITRHYRALLPLFPRAAATLDLAGHDLILSTSHAAAKGIRKPPGSLHVCYCFTPMRYIWDAESDYFHYGDSLGLRRGVLALLRRRLRAWDRASANGVDRFIAISRHVAERIERCYGRESDVVYPPVDTEFFTGGARNGDAPYLLVAALVPPKRVDLALGAFARLKRPLVVAGEGPDLASLQKRATPNVQFAGRVSDERLRELYRRCRGLIVPGREDFGLTAVEAQACGRGVVAYAAGGSLESVVDGKTGVLFERQTPDDLAAAVERFERLVFDPARLRAHAERFSTARFRAEIRSAIDAASRKPEAVRAAPARSAAHPSVSGWTGAAKRALDAVVALAALLVCGIPLALVAAAIRLQSPGPALFFQRRIGLGGREFTIVKLRTMVDGAERATGPTWAVENDARATPLGGFLRRYGIDELPQLWNVVRGEMSLVGPRPERPEFVDKFAARFPSYTERLAVRPGITGLAQVRGWRGDTPLEERLSSDLEYLARWSLALDAAVVARTPLSLARRRQSLMTRRRAAEG